MHRSEVSWDEAKRTSAMVAVLSFAGWIQPQAIASCLSSFASLSGCKSQKSNQFFPSLLQSPDFGARLVGPFLPLKPLAKCLDGLLNSFELLFPGDRLSPTNRLFLLFRKKGAARSAVSLPPFCFCFCYCLG